MFHVTKGSADTWVRSYTAELLQKVGNIENKTEFEECERIVEEYPILVAMEPGGKTMYVPDALSRLPWSSREHVSVNLEEFKVQSVVVASKKRIDEIKEEKTNDSEMKQVMYYIRNGLLRKSGSVSKEAKPYFRYEHGLYEHNGFIFMNKQLVIPRNLRSDMIYTSIRRTQDVFFWPHMITDIKEYVSFCRTCQKCSLSNTKKPLESMPIAKYPWERVAMDFMEEVWEINQTPSKVQGLCPTKRKGGCDMRIPKHGVIGNESMKGNIVATPGGKKRRDIIVIASDNKKRIDWSLLRPFQRLYPMEIWSSEIQMDKKREKKEVLVEKSEHTAENIEGNTEENIGDEPMFTKVVGRWSYRNVPNFDLAGRMRMT
ncbi:hypothetical protein JTB14_036720 [Gonioctena quinquepunctata]|nr:hypothetical protein JTB14_036720 [Gonioctena quinquepunctata]